MNLYLCCHRNFTLTIYSSKSYYCSVSTTILLLLLYILLYIYIYIYMKNVIHRNTIKTKIDPYCRLIKT